MISLKISRWIAALGLQEEEKLWPTMWVTRFMRARSVVAVGAEGFCRMLAKRVSEAVRG
jgi:hypothetical protein